MSDLETQVVVNNWEQLLFDEHTDNLKLALALSSSISPFDVKVRLLIKYLMLWTQNQAANYNDGISKTVDMQNIYEHLQHLELEFSIDADFFIFGAGIEQRFIIVQWWQQFQKQIGNDLAQAVLAKGLPYLPWLYQCFLHYKLWHYTIPLADFQTALRKYGHLQAEDTKIIFKQEIHLTHLPEPIFKIPTLKTIHCENCPLQSLPMALLYQCKNLETLHLINVSLKALSLDLYNLPKLQHLAFSNGERRLNLELNGEHQLQSLDISYNLLKRLPMWLWEMKKLSALSLDDMNLTQFPPAVLALTQLQKLSMRYTNFTNFPQKFTRFKQLKYLDLSNSHWSQLPDFFNALESLEVLKLNHCNFKNFPHILTQMPKLKYLEMDDNFIRFIDEDILLQLCQKLRFLSVKNAFSTTPRAEEFKAFVEKNAPKNIEIIF